MIGEVPSPLFACGNALKDAVSGWFIGHFVREDGLRRRCDFEVKWGVHRCGERRPRGWTQNRTATTVTILLRGRFMIQVRIGEEARALCLKDEGDYVILAPGLKHKWEALEDSVLISIRAPSVPDDKIEAQQNLDLR